ncbi:MAG: ABC transporter ATP-binding protein, partial [Bdellovibrionota bacterium]
MSKAPPLSWKSFQSATRNLRPAVTLVWEADHLAFSLLALITALSSVLPVGQALLGRWIVDSVLAAANEHLSGADGMRRVAPYLLGEFGLIFLGLVLTQYRKYVSEILNQKLSQSVATKIMKRAAQLDIQYFEDAAFLDKLQSARQETKFRAMGLVNAGFFLAQNVLTLISFATPMIAFSPWVAALLFGSTLPAFVAQTYYSRLSFRLHSWRAPEGRKMNYYEHLLTSDAAAKEIRIFQLARALLDRHGELFHRVFREDQKLAVRKSLASVFWGVVSTLSFYACYAWIILKAVTRAISLGQMTFYLASFRQLQGTFSGLFENINSVYENGLFMHNLFAVLEAPTRTSVTAKEDFTFDTSKGIEFRNVSFRYPEQTSWALRHFSLTVKKGQTIALVGENGSGKTTLIKLLTRLYIPTEGEIILFGRPLSLFPDAVLYSLFGAIFQDFVHYQATAQDNVGFGAIDAREDLPRVQGAAAKAGAREFVEAMPEGWETMFGGWFQKGRQLSGGQWQRIALSRAFMRDAEILVLDEPTSALDAENEQAIFSRLQEMAGGKIAFLVSHRFSTVRRADQIV